MLIAIYKKLKNKNILEIQSKIKKMANKLEISFIAEKFCYLKTKHINKFRYEFYDLNKIKKRCLYQLGISNIAYCVK